MDAFDRLRGRLGQYREQKRLVSETQEFEDRLAANPNDQVALQRLADLYLTAGRGEDAINCLSSLAELNRADGRLETALAFYRKAEKLAGAERRAHILRRMIPIQRDLTAYSAAFKLAQEVIEYYIANGQEEVALGFFKTLPELGERDEAYRRELGEMFLLRDNTWAEGARGTWHGKTGRLPSPDDFSELTVLLVDDEPGQLKQIVSVVETLGCQIVTASNGVEALARVAERRPSLIISDLVMPRMDGSQLFEHLQADPVTEAIPFVCLTSRDDEGEQASALERGVEDYWLKPFRPQVLRARIKRILKRLKHHSALAGDLSEMSLPDLLQMLEANARTGSLLLESAGRTAVIYVADGRPIDASYEGREGEEAIYTIIDWHEGRFQFSPRMIERPQRIFVSAQGILLEAMRRLDEEEDAKQTLPSDPDAILVWVSDPPTDNMPEGTSPYDLERVKPMLDGTQTVTDILMNVKGRLELVQLVTWLYSRGYVTTLASAEPQQVGVEAPAAAPAVVQLVQTYPQEPPTPPTPPKEGGPLFVLDDVEDGLFYAPPPPPKDTPGIVADELDTSTAAAYDAMLNTGKLPKV
jgi:CheY-like chemotaxis protein